MAKRGRPRKKRKYTIRKESNDITQNEPKIEFIEAVELTDKEKLELRQKELINLIEKLQAEGVPIPSQLEMKLSQVNQELTRNG